MGKLIEQALETVAQGEKIVLEKSLEPDPSLPSWYLVARVGEVPSDKFAWINAPDDPFMARTESFYYKYRSVKDVPTPQCKFVGMPNQLCDFYNMGGGAFILSERALHILQALDPDSIEWAEADVTGTETRFYLGLCRRSIDAIDEARTTIIVSSEALYPGSDKYLKRARPEGYTYNVDSALCTGMHLFVNYYTSETLFSKAAVDAFVNAGCRNLYFEPTDSDKSAYQIRLY